MPRKLPKVLTIMVDLANKSPRAAVSPSPKEEIDTRAQPWRVFKREAVKGESPEMALLSTRDETFGGGSEAG
jgi:hypothetical protein